jgi:radical SAM superfamily enzyme YgiQ (UPF0313 family)
MDTPFGGYDAPPFRPPNEAGSALIRVTRGCPWNRCTFCAMYKSERFAAKSLDEVKADAQAAREIYGPAQSVFLGDSDSLVHKDMPEIVAFIREVFPEARRITTYARAKTVVNRRMEFLHRVRAAGLDRLHFGLESGDAEVLDRLDKGATPENMVEAAHKAREAGFETSFYVLSGAGGRDRWREHAVNSARALNAAAPGFIRLRTLTVQAGTPLDDALKAGDFELTPPRQRLEEVRLFMESLDLEGCFLASDHLTNYLWEGDNVFYRGIAGVLPEEKARMLWTLERAIAHIEASDLEIRDSNRLYREGILTRL